MTKGIVICKLWKRKGKPSVNAEKLGRYYSGDEVEILDVVLGETENDYYEGTPTWYKLTGDVYVWSGGVSLNLQDRFLSKKLDLDKDYFDRKETEENNIPKKGDKKDPFSFSHRFDFNVHQAFDWWHQEFEIKDLWNKLENCGDNVNVVVLDSGIYKTHSHLKNAKIRTANIWDDTNSANDTNGHGTQVSSVIVSQGKDFVGIAPLANLFVVKINKSGRSEIKDIIKGIQKVPKETDIVCIAQALRLEDYSESEIQVLERAIDESGVQLFVCSAGNSSDRSEFNENLPATLSNTISVASIKPGKSVSTLSSSSKKIDISGPGENMKCLLPGSETYFGPGQGTSLAAGYMTGFLSIGISYLKSKGKHNISLDRWRQILEYSSDGKRPREIYGYGIIDTNQFITQIKSI